MIMPNQYGMISEKKLPNSLTLGHFFAIIGIQNMRMRLMTDFTKVSMTLGKMEKLNLVKTFYWS